MKIGYPCLNWTIGCNAGKTFRLQSYTNERLLETVENNLECTLNILKYNKENGFKFFRISSELVPFASHPINEVEWWNIFDKKLQEIGKFVKDNNMRISMHPDQFVLINSLDEKIFEKSLKDLEYHARILDGMRLDSSAKIQIHVGGVYGDKPSSIKRFIERYKKLPKHITERLIIENDDKSYSLKDCLEINKETKIPIIFDSFHHECLNNGELLENAIILASKTWSKKDGILLMDYSSQNPEGIKGKHCDSINIKDFEKFIKVVKELHNSKDKIDIDLMLEIRDKEKSAIEALKIIKKYELDA